MCSTNININITQYYRIHKIKEIYASLLQTYLEYAKLDRPTAVNETLRGSASGSFANIG